MRASLGKIYAKKDVQKVENELCASNEEDEQVEVKDLTYSETMFSKKYYLSSWIGVGTAVFQQLTGIMCIL
tara:strand:- start:777 stop:989 length:213 start_codon:yes stop_codon:yes gene_type:complete